MAKTNKALEFEPRRADEPGQVYDYNGPDGERVTLRADAEGVVQPGDQADVRAADAFGLPVARKVLAEAKAEAKAEAADEPAKATADAGKEG